MNLTKILKQEYINFFSTEQCKISHRLFRNFLNDMADISIYEDVNGYVPNNTLRVIMDDFGYSSNFYSHLKDVIKDMRRMTSLEAFTILYFACSRNNFNFTEAFAEECANNGIIYECLIKLQELESQK